MGVATELAPGVYGLGTRWVNWYVIVDGGVTVVDSGFPAYHDQLPAALASIGRSLGDVVAVVLTHYHPDHVGCAERIRREAGATVYAPSSEAAGIRGEARVPRPPGLLSNAWRPAMLRYLAHAAAAGVNRHDAVRDVRTYAGGEVLDVPGRLRAISTPGHSRGHCAVVDDDRGILFAGDALATVSFASSRTGPQPAMLNEDRPEALASLERLAGVEGELLLCGHGKPHHGPVREAVALARGAVD